MIYVYLASKIKSIWKNACRRWNKYNALCPVDLSSVHNLVLLELRFSIGGHFFASRSRSSRRVGWNSGWSCWIVNIVNGLTFACRRHSRIGHFHAAAAAHLWRWRIRWQWIVTVRLIIRAWISWSRIWTGAIVHFPSWMGATAKAWIAARWILKVTYVAAELRCRCCFCVEKKKPKSL